MIKYLSSPSKAMTAMGSERAAQVLLSVRLQRLNSRNEHHGGCKSTKPWLTRTDVEKLLRS